MSEQSGEKFMPQPFPWQENALRDVMDQHRRGRLHHAWLLHGPVGIGKWHFAMALAAARLCRSAAESGQACGQCKSCHLIRAGSHPDLLQVVPEPNRTALKIERVREIGEFVSSTASYAGSARVVVLSPVEALGQGAANALLKNLEEPPGDSLFLLISHVPGSVLPTIRSRCQPLAMPQPAPAVTHQWLRDHTDDPEQAEQAARLAPSQPLRALQLMDDRVPALFAFLDKGSSEFVAGRTTLADLIQGCRDSDARQVIAYLLGDLHRRTVSHVRESKAALSIASPLLQVYRDLLNHDRQLAGVSNPNRQLTLESAFLRWKQGVSQCP